MVTQEKSKQAPDTLSAAQFAIEAARLAANTRCHNITVLDVRGVSPITDYMVIATGTSPRQMKTVADEIEEFAQPHGYRPYSRADDKATNWTIIDFVNVVVHIFSTETRSYYDLDALWGDAKKVEWEQASA